MCHFHHALHLAPAMHPHTSPHGHCERLIRLGWNIDPAVAGVIYTQQELLEECTHQELKVELEYWITLCYRLQAIHYIPHASCPHTSYDPPPTTYIPVPSGSCGNVPSGSCQCWPCGEQPPTTFAGAADGMYSAGADVGVYTVGAAVGKTTPPSRSLSVNVVQRSIILPFLFSFFPLAPFCRSHTVPSIHWDGILGQ